jgi:hypothetical protein
MAEQAMETAQKARRRADYDYVSSSEDEGDEEDVFGLLSSSSETTTIRKRGAPSSSTTTTATTIEEGQRQLPLHHRGPVNTTQSLLEEEASVVAAEDDELLEESLFEMQPIVKDVSSSSTTPGVAGYLEIEEEPPRHSTTTASQNYYGSEEQPISTSSGLLLTHRKSPTLPQKHLKKQYNLDDPNDRMEFLGGTFSSPKPNSSFFEVEHPYSGSGHSGSPRHSMAVLNARRLLSYVRIWMLVSGALLFSLTGVLWHAFHYGGSVAAETVQEQAAASASSNTALFSGQQPPNLQPQHIHIIQQHPDKILLLPMENVSQMAEQQQNQLRPQQEAPPPKLLGHHSNHHNKKDDHRHLLSHHGQTTSHQHGILRQEFEKWVLKHGKQYHSHEEKEHRWNVWLDNHHKTAAKNERHGPCKLTKQPVFGDNHLKDLTHEEFKAQFLTGYNGPTADALVNHPHQQSPGIRRLSPGSGHVLDPTKHKATIHPTVHERMLKQRRRHETTTPSKSVSTPSCEWYNVPCWLRWFWREASYTVGAAIGTLEPAYDADSYPNSVDWRQAGAVTSIRAQGDCGACWAITAVENVESAHFIATGTLYDLSETEVIACDESCEMCNGGWPQNAYEYVMEHGGLPLKSDLAYDGTTLMSLTEAWEQSEEDSYSATTVANYQAKVCPAGDAAQASSGSNSQDGFDNDNGGENSNFADYSSRGRYANIKSYGYATERCVCYSDGSGCDCNDQDETKAIRNIASYGPGVVCIEASLWQDYTGGIITTDLGCGSEFLDMNHCVQVVGYAYGTGSAEGDYGEEGEEEGGNSHSGSQDDNEEGERQGYWIVRNQWGNYWGMSGYAYVAMGANTCGILNDMTIVQS